MEIIPTVMLWLCMPINTTPVPVTKEDLGMFPALHIIKAERDLANERHNRANRLYYRSNCVAWGWGRLMRESGEAYYAWSELYWAHNSANEHTTLTDLECLRTRIGYANYYAGQMPAPVEVPLPPKAAGYK